MTSLGNQIQEAREKANMTQAQLADALGVSREEIAAWERDAQVPEKKMLQKVGDRLGTVFFDPGSLEAQRKSDAKLEKVKAAEFQGKKGGLFGGDSSEDGGSSKMWLIPLILALVLALAVYLLLRPKISELTSQVNELKQSFLSTDKNLTDVNQSLSTDLEAAKTAIDSVKADIGTANAKIDAANTEIVSVKADIGAANTKIDAANTEIGSVQTSVNGIQRLFSGEGTLFAAKGKQIQFLGETNSIISVAPEGTVNEKITIRHCGENWAVINRLAVKIANEEDLTFDIQSDKQFVINGNAARDHLVNLMPSDGVMADSPVLFTLYSGEAYFISACQLVYFDKTGKAQTIDVGMNTAHAEDAVLFVPDKDILVQGIRFFIPAGSRYTSDIVWEPYVGITRPKAWAPYRGKTYTWVPELGALEVSAFSGANTLFSTSGESLSVRGQRTENNDLSGKVESLKLLVCGAEDGMTLKGKFIQFSDAQNSTVSVIPNTIDQEVLITHYGGNWASINRLGVKMSNEEDLTFKILSDKRFVINGNSTRDHVVDLMPYDGVKADSPVLFTLLSGETYYISGCCLVYFDESGIANRIDEGMDTPSARDAVPFTPDQDIQVRGIQFITPAGKSYSEDTVWEPYVGKTQTADWVPCQLKTYSWKPGYGALQIDVLPGLNTLYATPEVSLLVNGVTTTQETPEEPVSETDAQENLQAQADIGQYTIADAQRIRNRRYLLEENSVLDTKCVSYIFPVTEGHSYFYTGNVLVLTGLNQDKEAIETLSVSKHEAGGYLYQIIHTNAVRFVALTVEKNTDMSQFALWHGNQALEGALPEKKQADPSAESTEAPIAEPTAAPTAEPTATPTAEPTAMPTEEPTDEPA